MSNLKICSVYKRSLDLSNFYIRKDRMKPISRCKKCNALATIKSRAKLTKEQKQNYYKKRSLYFEKQAREGNLKAILQHKINSYKHTAKDKKVDFNLTVDYLVELFNKQKGLCYYTGEKLDVVIMLGRGQRKNLFSCPNHFSLDRLIPKKGYIMGNVAWCTYQANTCKNQLSEEQFYSFCKEVLNYKNKCQKCQDDTFGR